MKRRVFILLQFLFSIQFIYSNGVDTLYDFPQYKLSNIKMQIVLKEVSSIAESCPYFEKLHKKFYIKLDLDTDCCYCSIYPHNVTTISFYKESLKEYYTADGVCFYNGHIVYIQDHSKIGIIDSFFMNTNSTTDLYLDVNENYIDHFLPSNAFYVISYNISGKIPIRNVGYEDTEHCYNRDFEYLIKRGDSWKSIAEKCGCTEKNLKEEYYEYEHPIPGLMISVSYNFDDKGEYLGVKRLY